MVHQTNSNMPYIYFYHYKKEKLLASAPIKASFEKFTLHPLKPKNVRKIEIIKFIKVFLVDFKWKQLF